MAGELLIQTFDERAHRELLPVLDELRATLRVTAACRATVQRALAARASESKHGGGRELLERMARRADVEPEYVLSPSELAQASNAHVYLLCFENGGDYSLVSEIGPTWVVLDQAQRTLVELDWYERMFLGSEPSGVRLQFPDLGETTYFKLARGQVEELSKELDSLPSDSDVSRLFPDSMNGLRRLVARACASSSLSLVYRTLL